MAGTAQAAAASGGGGDAFAAAHRAVLADRSLQFQFEDVRQPKVDPHSMDWLERLFKMLGPYLQWVFWGGLIALAGLLIFLVAREIIARWPTVRAKAKAEAPAPVIDVRPTQERAHALLEEADRLAREGRYSEAVRVLLHRSIDDMERNFPISISTAMTSREIASIERLSAQARDVFSRIALAVEISLFGGRDLNAQQYQDCRSLYEGFALGAGR
ncbi:MAG: hypothetical protein ABUL42_02065 [Terricaulis silvestris]